MKPSFRKRFVTYMSEGIPLEMSDEDMFIFFERLDSFINTSNNEFESIYVKGDDSLSICDKFIDYLVVTYAENKLIFKTTKHTNSAALSAEPEVRIKMGEAFLGVIVFVESLAPAGDLEDIPEIYRDRW